MANPQRDGVLTAPRRLHRAPASTTNPEESETNAPLAQSVRLKAPLAVFYHVSRLS